MTDIIVAGAGPAGYHVAELLARRGLGVALLDPQAPWEKPCGGGLTAAALRHTPELNELRDDGELVRELRLIAPDGASVVVPLRQPYLVVSRLAFSRWGIDRARRAGADFYHAGVRAVDDRGDHWIVTDTRYQVHQARWLIAADGAASMLRHQLAPGLDPGRHAARVAYTARGTPSGQAALRFLSSGQGYAWDFPRPGNHSIGVAVPAGKLQRAELDRLIEDLRVKEDATGGGTYHGALLTTWDWRAGWLGDLGDRRYVLLGDAAGLADPVTGEGIDYALRSARLAAEVFHEDSGFSTYPASVQQEFAEDHRRAKSIRRWFYHPRIVQHLVTTAHHSPVAAELLQSLANAMNEHLAVGRAVRRGILSSLHGTSASGGTLRESER